MVHWSPTVRVEGPLFTVSWCKLHNLVIVNTLDV